MNRVTAHTGSRYPIVQAPMGWIARSQLASAVSRAGGLGVIETSSTETSACQDEIELMRASGLPFGVNLPIRFLKDDAMLRFVCDSGIRFVTTSAGSPARFIEPLHAAGIVVYHAVPTLDAALKCEDAGVDGLVVEGAEGGGFKNPEEVSTLVLIALFLSAAALYETYLGYIRRQLIQIVATRLRYEAGAAVTGFAVVARQPTPVEQLFDAMR